MTSSLRRSLLLFSLGPIAACNPTDSGDLVGPDAGELAEADGGGATSSDGGSDGGSVGAPGCPSLTVALEETTPTVMLLIDRSGSMRRDFSSTNRWAAVYETLMGGGGIVPALEGRVRFGAALYTSRGGFAGTEGLEGEPAGTCPMLAKVSPSLNNAQTIDAMYAPLDPVGDTPTAPSIDAMAGILEGITEPGPKVIILATDGDPDSCENPDANGEQGPRDDVVAATEAARAADISTYVISVGRETNEAHLQDVANAGVGLPVGGATNSPFYRGDKPADLVDAFDKIIAGVRSCSFSMDQAVEPDTAAERGVVTLDGVTLQHGTDWRLSDSQTLELLGDACDTILAGSDHELNAEFSCGIVIP